MKKKYIVKHQHDFDRIIKLNNFEKTSKLVIYKEKSTLDYDCFGISVGKKLGNAVYRNRKKRQLRSIIDEYFKEKESKETYNYIVILRQGGKDSTYNELKDNFFLLMRKDNNEKN